jgi:hypothetical protein
MKKLLLVWIIFMACIFMTNSAFAQYGAWISHSLPESVNGVWLSETGETCAGCVPENSQYIYFFDINSSRWTQVNLPSQEHFHGLQAQGQTIMAYSDSLLVGYSAVLSRWDIVVYEGTPLNPSGSGVRGSWGCGDKLAYFLTDTKMYVFDTELGIWQTLDYTLPPAFTTVGFYWAEDDYVGVILHQAPPAYNKVLVYSLHTHSFNQLDKAGDYHHPDCLMTHGFVTQWTSGTSNLLHGYSAFDNQFAERSITGYLSGSATRGSGDIFLENTAAAFLYTEAISSAHWRGHLFGYDTRLGSWSEGIQDFDPQVWSQLYGFINGGQLSAAYQVNANTQETLFIFYNGQSGNFEFVTPDLYSLGGYVCGGTVITAANADSVWFYTIEGGLSQLLPRRWQSPIWYPGNNYAFFGTYYLGVSDSLDLYFYNGATNNVTHRTTWRTNQILGTPYLCAFATGGPGNHVYFYSGIDDGLSDLSFPEGVYTGIYTKGKLAMVNTSSLSCLYDATTNSLLQVNYLLGGNLGGSSALLKKDSHTAIGYSTETHNWTEFHIPENYLSTKSGEYIGLVTSRTSPYTFDKFYAYNGFYDNLVPLQAIGIHQTYGDKVGGQTALVVHDVIIYAFDPHAIAEATTALTFRRSSLGLPITYNSILEDTLVVDTSGKMSQAYTLAGVEVLIDTVLHTSCGDLEFTLSHNSVIDTLIYQAGGTGDNFIGTRLSDAATIPISSGTPPFSGRYLPHQPLSPFAGQDPDGAWILQIYDGATGDTGTLETWGLKLYLQEVTGIEPVVSGIPKDYQLYQNYPNPFNPTTTITFSLPRTELVTLKIYNILGQELSSLVEGPKSAGIHQVKFNAAGLSSGVYFYRLEAGGRRYAKKMVLIK